VTNGLEQAYAITSYDSAELTYGIDELNKALFPRLSCDWPCGNCEESDRGNCTSCLPPDAGAPELTPQFLYTEEHLSLPQASSGWHPR